MKNTKEILKKIEENPGSRLIKLAFSNFNRRIKRKIFIREKKGHNNKIWDGKMKVYLILKKFNVHPKEFDGYKMGYFRPRFIS